MRKQATPRFCKSAFSHSSSIHALSIIKNTALHALDNDSEEPQEYSLAEFRSIADPLTVLQMAQEIERRPTPEDYAEMLQLLQEMMEFVEKQPGDDARVLAMKAKVLL